MTARPLPRRVTAGYGATEMGIAAVDFFLQVTLLKFATDVLGVGAGAAGGVIALAVLWDAVTDPVMGAVSDHTRGRWGRRRAYIAVGGVATAVAFTWLFTPPELASTTARIAFLLGAYLLANTALTVLSVPHAALGGELTTDPVARTRVFGARFAFANLGMVAAILVPGLVTVGLQPGTGSAAARASRSALAIGIIVVVTCIVTVIATRGRDRSSGQGALTMVQFLRSMAAVIANRPFRPLVAAFVVGSIGRALNASTALFYYEHRLRLDESDVFLKVLLPFTLVIAISIVGWSRLAAHVGRKPAATTGFFLLGLLGAIFYPLFPPGSLVGPVVSAVVGGLLVGAAFLLDATVADVVDYDEVKSGEHREGLYFGFWRLGSKVARALGIALSGVLLDVVGFVQGAPQQSASTSLGLALIFGPGVGVFFMSGAVLFACMPLDERIHARVRRILERRRMRRPVPVGDAR